MANCETGKREEIKNGHHSWSSGDDVLRVIHEAYGCPDLKPKQKKVLKSFVEGKDVFVSLPTGYI